MLVENLLLTAQFILSVVFSFLRQAIKMGRFLHNYQFFLTLVEQISRIGNTVQPTLPCWVVPTAGSLCIGDRWDGKQYFKSGYVFLPLTFENDSTMTLSWKDKISIDVKTGKVK